MTTRVTLGLLIDWIATPYHMSILQGVLDSVRRNNVNIISFVAGRLEATLEWEKCRNVLFDFPSRNKIDALLILAPTIANIVGMDQFSNFVKRYKEFPIVTIGEKVLSYPCILIDNKIGMRNLVSHLIEKHGYERLAFVTGPEKNREAKERFEAYKEVLEEFKIPLDKKLIVQGNFHTTSGRKAVIILMDERKVKFDAIVSSNDTMAVGIIEELQKRRIRVPEDIPVVGFDDIECSQYLRLTTVRQPLYQYGEIAVEILLKKIRGEEVPSSTYIQTNLVIRNSCGCFSHTQEMSVLAYKSLSSFGEFFTYIVMRSRESIILEVMEKKRKTLDEKLLLGWTSQILDALVEEVSGKVPYSFIYTIDKILFSNLFTEIDLYFVEDILHTIQKHLFSFPMDEELKKYLETIFAQAEDQIYNTARRREAFQKTFFMFTLEDINDVGERLITSLDINDELKVIYRELPGMGIKNCFLSIYENPEKPLLLSRLILAFREGKLLYMDKNGIKFNTIDLVPQKMLNEKKQYCLIVNSLFQGYEQIGFVIFSVDSTIDFRSFEFLRHKISVALKGSMLIEEIRKQAENLKKEVKARTAELTATNLKLKKEIEGKKKIEKRLKKVLEELRKTNERLHRQTIQDEMTGLYNRRGFILLSEQHYKYAKRAKKNFLLIFCDMDELKKINDQFGHKEGDFALKKTASLLKHSFRDVDIIGRLGGDEFTVLVMDGNINEKDFYKSRISEQFERFNARFKKPYKLSISIGFAFFDGQNPKTMDALFSDADKELYIEKADKHNRA